MQPYQTFPNEIGGSNSEGKLKSLQLPKSMEGKSFLDLGCNEGFFCLEAKRRGARIVVGIDKDPEFIKKAKERAIKENSDITYICDTWENFPEGKFDYILFSSALHYVATPILLFNTIYNHLTDTGLLILECGYTDIITNPASSWIPRIAGPCFHPRQDVLTHQWLQSFVVRHMGPSVMQVGDPVIRGVFHCNKWETTVVFIVGTGNIGKSSIALKLATMKNIIHIDDLFFKRFSQEDFIPVTPEEIKYKECYQLNKGNLEIIWGKLKDEPETINYFVEILSKAILLNKGTDVIVVEGYNLELLTPLLQPMLNVNGFRYWILNKGE
jgi:hypothetical protein